MPSRPSLADIAAIDASIETIEADPVAPLKPSACLSRLPDRYFTEFDTPTVARHVAALCRMTPERPFHLILEPAPEGTLSTWSLTVLSFDVEGILGLLTGILGATGFNIQAGSVYTFTRQDAPRVPARGGPTRYGPRSRRNALRLGGLPSRRIVDRFLCTMDEGVDGGTLEARLETTLGRVLPQMLPEGEKEVARRIVNEAVAENIRRTPEVAAAALFPVDITFEPRETTTRMTIVSEDTPYFLYALSTALSLQGVSIESVKINTEHQVIRDELELTDRAGKAIAQADRLRRIRLSVLLTKQFTYFLGGAPDPYAALVRFESMGQEIVSASEQEGVAAILSQPLILQELARLLGTSDYLWEDFIRGQYEQIIPMLDRAQQGYSTPASDLAGRVDAMIAEAGDPAGRREALNRFKDTEIFLIDLDHILQRDQDFFFLSNKLSDLADVTVQAALRISWEECTGRYGVPRSVAGLPAAYAVFGLGKLGGRAIGYASDLELLFVYSDNGKTDGAESITNAEFFERFVTEAAGCVESKREGIFQVDLRLRPYGNAGPHAVSLESFNRYFGRGGDAQSYEKLALTRLRFIAGSSQLGHRVEQLRDDLVYASNTIALGEVAELRERQLAEKASGTRLNAKFSPGALVDLEYGLQILLVQHGRTNERLRTPSLHAGLEELSRSGVMDEEEANRLVRAYRFLRNLINGLRMLRGNAQDLFLPEPDSLEFEHLARRTGYQRSGELSAADQLRIEFQARTAAVRAFLEHHLGRDSIPGKPSGTAADLVLSDGLGEELVRSITASASLRDPARAMVNLRALAGTGEQREIFTELIVLAWSSLGECSEPDMALNNWERYVSGHSNPEAHFRSLLRQPAKLALMLEVFSASQFLAEILIKTPAFLEWALDQSVVQGVRSAEEMLEDLRNELRDDTDGKAVLRWFRQREILRIGTRDICLETPIETITGELSALAEAVVRADLERIWAGLDAPQGAADQLCLLAFGKLGGGELNYSSDIDLLGIHDDRVPEPCSARVFSGVLETLRGDLSTITEHGYAFRVDFRLRPHGSSGALVPGITAAEKYYRTSAHAWEHQALIKLRPIAGNIKLGKELLEAVRPSWSARWAAGTVISSIRRMREEAVKQSLRRGDDIKSGEGGIRDIEFTVQGLQMLHSDDNPEILTGNTFEAIRRLREAGFMDDAIAGTLLEHYRLLRRVEHFLQILEDRQVHSMPTGEANRTALARRVAGRTGDSASVFEKIAQVRSEVHQVYERFLESGAVNGE